MGYVYQLVAIALVTGIAAIILKGTKPEIAFAVSVAGGIILLLFAIDALKETFHIFQLLVENTGIDAALIKILVKMLGIAYLIEFAAGILNDFGQNSVADKLIFCGRVIIALMALPVLESILSLINRLLGVIP